MIAETGFIATFRENARNLAGGEGRRARAGAGGRGGAGPNPRLDLALALALAVKTLDQERSRQFVVCVRLDKKGLCSRQPATL